MNANGWISVHIGRGEGWHWIITLLLFIYLLGKNYTFFIFFLGFVRRSPLRRLDKTKENEWEKRKTRFQREHSRLGNWKRLEKFQIRRDWVKEFRLWCLFKYFFFLFFFFLLNHNNNRESLKEKIQREEIFFFFNYWRTATAIIFIPRSPKGGKANRPRWLYTRPFLIPHPHFFFKERERKKLLSFVCYILFFSISL